MIPLPSNPPPNKWEHWTSLPSMGKPCPLQTAPSVPSFTVRRLPSWRLYRGVLLSANLPVADGSLRTITILSTHRWKLKIQQATNTNLFNTHLTSQVEASPGPTEQNAGILNLSHSMLAGSAWKMYKKQINAVSKFGSLPQCTSLCFHTYYKQWSMR